MAFVKLCPRCDGEFVPSVETCPDCGVTLEVAPEGRSGSLTGLPPTGQGRPPEPPAVRRRGEPRGLDPAADAATWGPPSTSGHLEAVARGDLDVVQTLGTLLDHRGIHFRVELLEPPGNSASAGFTGIPNPSGLYELSVAPGDLEEARAQWAEEVLRNAPPPDGDGLRDQPPGEDPQRWLDDWAAADDDAGSSGSDPGSDPGANLGANLRADDRADDRADAESWELPAEEPGEARFRSAAPLTGTSAAPPAAPSPSPPAATARRRFGPLRLLALLGGLLLAYLLAAGLLGLRIPLPNFGADPAKHLTEDLPEADPPLSDHARMLFEQGLEHYSRGEIGDAVRRFDAALEAAPDSPTLRFFLAHAQAFDGRTPAWVSLQHAALAAERAPQVAAHVALHADLLHLVGLDGEARRVAAALDGRRPETGRDALWMAYLFHDIEQPRALLAATDPEAPWTRDRWLRPFFQGEHLWALLHLGRRDEAAELFAELRPDEPGVASLQRYADAYQSAVAPLELARRLTRRGMAAEYGELEMERIVDLGAPAGLPAARRRVEGWLTTHAASREDWLLGLAWVEPERRAALLDRHLAALPLDSPRALAPGLARLELSDPLEPLERRRLARRLAGLEIADPEDREWVDAGRYLPGPSEPYHVELAAFRRHVEWERTHAYCRLALVSLLTATRPTTAGTFLDGAEAAIRRSAMPARVAPWLRMDAQVLRLEVLLAEDRAAEALAVARGLPLGAGGFLVSALDVEQRRAEAAFLAGDEALLDAQLALLLRSGDSATEAAALLLRWSRQWAAGRPATYRQDVDALVERHGEAALAASRGRSAQGIAAAEGWMEAAELRRRMAAEDLPTPELVRLFAGAAGGESAAGDLAALREIAAGPHPGQYAAWLARRILAGAGAGD